MIRPRKFKYLLFGSILVCICYFSGITDYLLSKHFNDNFDYPLNVDIKSIVDDFLMGKEVHQSPINYYRFRFLSNSGICTTLRKIDLFIAVKSAMDHFEQRNAIRKTFGSTNSTIWVVRTLFFLGIDQPSNSILQKSINKEMKEHKDIIQMDFLDTYYNNTIKTMMTFRWLYEYCSHASYYLFTDDDMYISVDNLMNYVKHKMATPTPATDKKTHQLQPTTTETGRRHYLFAGYVFNSAPQRFLSSKWRVSLEEYRWSKWPPYVTAGAYIMNNETMQVMYIASLYVKHFRFDDIYLGIVAKKVGITPTHCSGFHFYKKLYTKISYKDVIASHGYGDPGELIKVWNEQNTKPSAVNITVPYKS